MGDRIDFRDGRWVVPDRPVIPFIEGDGTGPDIWRASRRVFDAVVEKVSRGKRRVEWLEVLAGEKAFQQTGNWLPEATRLLVFLRDQFGAKIREGSALGIKPMSRFGSQRLVVKAIEYAIKARRPSVTLVHKGNIMKFTEGAFREWGYEVAKERFGD